MASPKYTKPASQVWAEGQQKNGNESGKVLSTFSEEEPESDGQDREVAVEGNETEGYVGVDPIYQTYANDTEAPLRSESGVERKLEKEVYGNDKVSNPKPKEAEVVDENSGSSLTPPSGIKTPPAPK